MSTNDGHDSAALSSEEKVRQVTAGEQGFINDEYATQKEKNRRQFGDLIKKGLAKVSDASMFHGSARDSKVKYRDEEF